MRGDTQPCRRLSGGSGDLVQQVKEQPCGERRARPVLHHDLPRANDLEFAEKAGRGRSDQWLQGFETRGSGGVAGLAAILAAVDASISTFCCMIEHPARAQRTVRIATGLQIIWTL